MDARPDTCDVACPSTAGRFLPDNRRNRRPYVRLARAAEIANCKDGPTGPQMRKRLDSLSLDECNGDFSPVESPGPMKGIYFVGGLLNRKP